MQKKEEKIIKYTSVYINMYSIYCGSKSSLASNLNGYSGIIDYVTAYYINEIA